MSDKSSIEWTESTWNPVVGCTQISPGCARCYAKVRHDIRHKAYLAGKRLPVQYAQPFEIVTVRPDRLDIPVHWKRPRTIFVNSTSDLFHGDVPEQFLHDVYYTMEQRAHWHRYQVLTKRSARLREYLSWRYGPSDNSPLGRIPSRHIWHGVSVENRRHRFRIDDLRAAPSAFRFISIEPLLEDIGALDLRGIDLVIIGFESGKNARAGRIEWVRNILGQCVEQGVHRFVKQLGAHPTTRYYDDVARNAYEALGLDWPDPIGWHPHDGQPGLSDRVRLHFHRKGTDPIEWPEDLRVREAFPAVRA